MLIRQMSTYPVMGAINKQPRKHADLDPADRTPRISMQEKVKGTPFPNGEQCVFTSVHCRASCEALPALVVAVFSDS